MGSNNLDVFGFCGKTVYGSDAISRHLLDHHRVKLQQLDHDANAHCQDGGLPPLLSPHSAKHLNDGHHDVLPPQNRLLLLSSQPPSLLITDDEALERGTSAKDDTFIRSSSSVTSSNTVASSSRNSFGSVTTTSNGNSDDGTTASASRLWLDGDSGNGTANSSRSSLGATQVVVIVISCQAYHLLLSYFRLTSNEHLVNRLLSGYIFLTGGGEVTISSGEPTATSTIANALAQGQANGNHAVAQGQPSRDHTLQVNATYQGVTNSPRWDHLINLFSDVECQVREERAEELQQTTSERGPGRGQGLGGGGSLNGGSGGGGRGEGGNEVGGGNASQPATPAVNGVHEEMAENADVNGNEGSINGHHDDA